MKRLALTLLVTQLFLSSASAQEDIVDTAIGAGNFSTLVTAVQAAGLEDALRGEGPFTVLAPTDEAFDALPAGTLAALLADPDTLRDVLLYHVTPGRFTAEIVLGLDEVTMLNGGTLTVDANNVAFIDANGGSAGIVATDIAARNGIIHVIDAVVIP